MPELRRFRRARQEKVADAALDQDAALKVAALVLERCPTEIPQILFRDPRGVWDPGLAELCAAVHGGDACLVQQIVGWALLYELHVNGNETTDAAAAVETACRVLGDRDTREARFSVLRSEWATAAIEAAGRHVTTEQVSPEPEGPFYFHRAFEDVLKYLRQTADGWHTTAIVWPEAPAVYDDAFDTPLACFRAERGRYPGRAFVTVRSDAGWTPPRFEVHQPLIPIPPRSEAGLVFAAILGGCIRVARLQVRAANEQIDKGIEFGCILGKGTQLDREALTLLRNTPHYQRSVGNALQEKPGPNDASAAVALFTGVPTLPPAE
jgi:hypothetical protein